MRAGLVFNRRRRIQLHDTDCGHRLLSSPSIAALKALEKPQEPTERSLVRLIPPIGQSVGEVEVPVDVVAKFETPGIVNMCRYRCLMAQMPPDASCGQIAAGEQRLNVREHRMRTEDESSV